MNAPLNRTLSVRLTDCDPFDDGNEPLDEACGHREIPVPAAPERLRYCQRCSALLTGRADLICSDACRMAVKRKTKSLRPLIRVIAQLVEGDVPRRGEAPPAWWGLLSRMLQLERAKVRAEMKARRLPGGGR